MSIVNLMFKEKTIGYAKDEKLKIKSSVIVF